MSPIKTLRYCLPALALAACTAQAQTLDKSRIVYRCEHQGKITYADEPCVGATEVDVTPTQGLQGSALLAWPAPRQRHCLVRQPVDLVRDA